MVVILDGAHFTCKYCTYMYDTCALAKASRASMCIYGR